MPGEARLRNVDGVTATTSPVPIVRRREMSPTGALLLSIAGGILVVSVLAVAAAATVLAGVLVFGGDLLDLV